MYSYGSPHMAAQKQDDQHEHTFSSYVRIQDVVLKTYLGRWTIGRSGERGSGISVLPARYDDDDDESFVCTQLNGFKYWYVSNNLIFKWVTTNLFGHLYYYCFNTVKSFQIFLALIILFNIHYFLQIAKWLQLFLSNSYNSNRIFVWIENKITLQLHFYFLSGINLRNFYFLICVFVFHCRRIINKNIWLPKSNIITYLLSARGVMVIVVGNGHGSMSSNPGRGWLHFTQH